MCFSFGSDICQIFFRMRLVVVFHMYNCLRSFLSHVGRVGVLGVLACWCVGRVGVLGVLGMLTCRGVLSM